MDPSISAMDGNMDGNVTEKTGHVSTPNGHTMDKDEAIEKLLVYCAERNIVIPEEICDTLDPEHRLVHAAPKLGRHYSTESSGRSNASSFFHSCISHVAEDLAEFEQLPLTLEIRKIHDAIKTPIAEYEIRVKNGSYTVTNVVSDIPPPQDVERGQRRSTRHIQTVTSPQENFFRKAMHFFQTGEFSFRPKTETKAVMQNIHLRLRSGKMYLILGAPGSGKSTLLKMIANTLISNEKRVVGGEVTVNNLSTNDKRVYWSNLVSYIDQIDRLHALMTVWETLKFAFDCRRSSTHRRDVTPKGDPEIDAKIKEMDEEVWAVNTILRATGLMRVKDTFVGDDSNVRGVSGGERHRMTFAEMLCAGVPISCLDEISTGLDAATTYDIIRVLMENVRLQKGIRLISLLQPPPETVALFDEIILLDKGQILYAGPISQVLSYFESIGYTQPARMDVADWLQSLPTPDGARYLTEEKPHLTNEQFVEAFWESDRGKQIKSELDKPLSEEVSSLTLTKDLTQEYQNPRWISLKLVLQREYLLWKRNKYQLRARIIQDLLMGIIVGTVFWQIGGESPTSVVGVLFQSLFFIMLGAMVKVPAQVADRAIFYKHQDANFFPTWTYVVGKSLASIPAIFIDSVLYGTIVYWFVGLAQVNVASFFVFLLLCFTTAFMSGVVFGTLPSFCKDRSITQATSSFTVIFLVVFSGFTVQPDVIPNYWIWAYWMNYVSWCFRGLVVNEFQSEDYSLVEPNGNTAGENALIQFGFVHNGEPFTYEWVWWAVLFSMLYGMLAICVSTFFLKRWRFETGKSLQGATEEEEKEPPKAVEEVELPFQRVDLTFKDIRYTVKASTSDEPLELLKGISGYFLGGKMTALMGSSGAGKTTLMDVLSMRKSGGTITGDIRLNGHPQESDTFRRCAGYVEQFDVQSAQLTVRETVSFSAKLRLDEHEPGVTPDAIDKLVEQTLDMLELTDIQDLQVGSDLTGGISFEQRKRLSIAVELAANPSIIFLDEPTSGLDARAASIVMRGMKRIAESGRAVIATIHQPSQAIFYSFDSLLLLKRGGETTFFGELGPKSESLINYFESYPCTDPIKDGENPATWMLTTIAGTNSPTDFDYAKAYATSRLHQSSVQSIDRIQSTATESNSISFQTKYARASTTQKRKVLERMFKIYWRSPSYNKMRIIMAAGTAFLFGTVFASQRVPKTESDMNSRVTSIYITAVFFGVYSFNTVLNVFEVERNMFYRHKSSLMYGPKSLIRAVTIVEIPFILVSSMIFNIFFYFMVGFSPEPHKFFLYYLFFTLNLCAWTFLGQAFMSLFKDSVTAQGFGAVLNSLNSLFAGVLIRPQFISGFWMFMYWIVPAHYVLEGLLVSQYYLDETPITASPGSAFSEYLNGTETCPDFSNPELECYGTAWQWVYSSFGGEFVWEHIPWNVLYLVCLCGVAKIISLVALMKLNYLSK